MSKDGCLSFASVFYSRNTFSPQPCSLKEAEYVYCVHRLHALWFLAGLNQLENPAEDEKQEMHSPGSFLWVRPSLFSPTFPQYLLRLLFTLLKPLVLVSLQINMHQTILIKMAICFLLQPDTGDIPTFPTFTVWSKNRDSSHGMLQLPLSRRKDISGQEEEGVILHSDLERFQEDHGIWDGSSRTGRQDWWKQGDHTR